MKEWNNVELEFKPRHWFTLPAVYSDALSYGDEIAKICYVLSKLVENNNGLPAYIQQLIEQYISGGVIGEIVNQIISQYILNPKYPPNNLTPAVGDGSADDTEAVQGCIDYLHERGGGAVYFPYGAFSVQSLTMYDNIALFGFGRYSTKIVLRGGAQNALFTGTVNGVSFNNLTLDANAGVQVNDVGVIDLTGQNIDINDCYILDGYTLVKVNGAGGVMNVTGCHFGNGVDYALDVYGNISVNVSGAIFTGLSAVSGVALIKTAASEGVYNFVCTATVPTAVMVSGNNNTFTFSASLATNAYQDTGEGNSFKVNGILSLQKYADTHRTDTKNEILHAETGDFQIAGDTNIETGALTENNASVNQTITGNEKKTVGGDSSITGVNYTETWTGDKVVSGVKKNETFSGNVNMTANDVMENVNKKTIQFKTGFFKTIFPNREQNLYYLNFECANVTDFGATGDGTTDDSNAFNAAIASGRDLYVPEGDYNIPSLNTINYSGTINCYGTIVSDVQFNTFTGKVRGGTWQHVTVANSSHDCEFIGCRFISTDKAAFYANNCDGLLVRDCYAKGLQNTFQIVESDFVGVEHCHVVMDSAETGDYHAMQFMSCTYCKFINCLSENATWFGYSVYNSNYCSVLDCISKNSLHEGINLENSNSCVIQGCYTIWEGDKSNDYGICIFGNGGNYANLNLIANCVVANSAQSGIAIDGNAHSNIAIGNILGNVNTKNVIRFYAMTSAQLEGYDGRPSNNYFLNNMIIAGKYTQGFFEEINPLGVNQVLGNGCDKLLPAGNYTYAIFANNYPSGTHPATITSQTAGVEVTEAFTQYISNNWAFIQCNLNITTAGSVTLTIPVVGSSIAMVLAYTQSGIISGLVTNNTITFGHLPNGIANMRALLHFTNVTIG